MAVIRQGVGELTITDDVGNSVTLHAGDEVPDWALVVYSNPRLIDTDGDGQPYQPDPPVDIGLFEGES